MKRILFTVLSALIVLAFMGCPNMFNDDNDNDETYYDAGYKKTNTANGVSYKRAYCPGGTFIMGEDVESTTKTVTLTKDFWMSETEVTQGLWEAVMGDTWPHRDPANPQNGERFGENYPAFNINWYDAIAFCNALTLLDPELGAAAVVYTNSSSNTYSITDASSTGHVAVNWSKAGYRLPTEAEWEYAARYTDGTNWTPGDHVSGDESGPCFGTESGSTLSTVVEIYAWYDGNTGDSGEDDYAASEVGLKEANMLGLKDMTGNVSEWCWDWYDGTSEYSGGSETDPTGLDSGLSRAVSPGSILRGGAWTDGYPENEALRCANRDMSISEDYQIDIGFRLVNTVN